MSTNDTAQRDLQLVRLLTERQLDEMECGASMLVDSTFNLESDRNRQDRPRLVVRFELGKGIKTTIADVWWEDGYRKVDHLANQAEDVAFSVKALWSERENITDMYAETLSAVRREVSNARRRDLPYSLVSAEICPVEAGNTRFPCVRVRVERIGASLLPENVTLEFDGPEEVKPAFAEMSETQKARRARQTMLQQAGADGEIDEVALRVMQSRGCDVSSILAKLPLAKGGILDVDLAEKGSRGMVLFWRDGVVHANIRISDSISWNDGSVTFRRVPERFPVKPHGRLLSEFVENEAFAKDLRIVSGYRSGDMASAGVQRRTMRFNSRTGETMAP